MDYTDQATLYNLVMFLAERDNKRQELAIDFETRRK